MSVSQKQNERKQFKRKKLLQQKAERRRHSESVRRFPLFEVVNRSGSDRFTEYVRVACHTVRREHQTRFNADIDSLLLAYQQGRFLEQAHHIGPGFLGSFVDLAVHLHHVVAAAIIAALPQGVRDTYFPVEHLEVLPKKLGGRRSFIVEIYGLEQLRNAGGTAYFSKYRPTVLVHGQPRLLAFTNHAVQRIAERMVVSDDLYAKASDAHLFVHRCRHFEPVTLPNGQLAITFYTPATEGMPGRIYVDRLLPEIDPTAFYHYRLGYCPIVLQDEVAIAKTFLFPGMWNTPEYALLRRHRLSAAAICGSEPDVDELTFNHMVRSGDLRLLRWFNDHGVEQIRTFDECLFHEEESRPFMTQRWRLVVPAVDGEPITVAHPVQGKVLPVFSQKQRILEYYAGMAQRVPSDPGKAITLSSRSLQELGAKMSCKYAVMNPSPERESESAILDLTRLDRLPRK